MRTRLALLQLQRETLQQLRQRRRPRSSNITGMGYVTSSTAWTAPTGVVATGERCTKSRG